MRTVNVETTMKRATLLAALLLAPLAIAEPPPYQPADLGQKPTGGGVRMLPDQFLRGYDPVTVYFPDDQVPAKANADDGPKRLKIVPEWPGGYSWVDRRTLQFRPAEPWPALARFQFQAQGQQKVLTTMMSAPVSMVPSPGSEGLKAFRVVTLTFPQALPVASLKKMLSLEVRDLPGVGDSPSRKVTNFSLAPLPRASHQDQASWAITMEDDVPEGKLLVVGVSLALGSEGTTLWQGRAATRTPFALQSVRCGSQEFQLIGGASTPKDMALSCGNRGEVPQLLFSAPVADLSLTGLRKLVRLEPAVPDLHFQSYGSRVQLQGKFVPDTLYKLTLAPAPLHDDSGRTLRDVKSADVYFHLGWKAPFLAWTQASAMLEANGPRTLPLRGYAELRADVRIYRVDPLSTSLWPWSGSPVTVNEDQAPPFPGEEPGAAEPPGGRISGNLEQHIKLLGSPLVSKVIDLPLGEKSGATTFGLDLKPLLDPVVGTNRPGTYLVGLRRLTGRPERSYMRVQVTNLSVTSVEELGRAVLYVRALDTGNAIKNANVLIEGRSSSVASSPVRVEGQTDGDGRVAFTTQFGWSSVHRISVTNGDDVLVLDPNEQVPRFASNHWSGGGSWLTWLANSSVPTPVNDKTLGFVFSERAIYKPGEPVFLKGYVRQKVAGELRIPADLKSYGIQVRGPDGQTWPVKLDVTPLGAFAGTFKEDNIPTGDFTAQLYDGNPESGLLATREFKIEAYRVPTFEVQVSGQTRVRNDAPFKVKALSRYYAGGNVANQPISWTVTQHPYFWMPAGLPGFMFASSTQFSRQANTSAQQDTTSTGELDDNGAAELTMNPQLDLDGSAKLFRFEATVTGPDEQQVTAYTEVKALPGFVLGLKVPRYLEKATELTPQVVAVGVDDKPIKGQEVRLRLFRRVWHSSLRETSFATGKAKYVTDQEDVQVAEKVLTSGDAPLSQTFPIPEAGVYVVELFARDKLGRVQTLQADLYIGGQAPQAWAKSRDGVFEMKPDKKRYVPGETAHLLVQSPYTQARALVVVEEPQGNRYTWKDVSGGKVVVDVPVTDRMVPNVPVHVVLMRGRLGEGKTDDARYKPATAAASLDLEVEPTRNIVTVGVQHPEMARPGTTIDVTVTLTDENKRALGGEVTLWLVDEAVLSLAREGTLDPLSEMVRRNARQVAIRDTRNMVVGKVSELEEEPGGDGGEDEESKGGKRLVRKEFKTVPYYAATLQVPPSGKLVVPIKLSDDLTNFKVRAVAVSGATRFGMKQTTLKVRLPVLVQPQLPRFVRMGDRFWPGAVARLVEGAEGPASVDIKVTGAIEGKASSQERIELKANKAQSVQTQATVKPGNLGKDGALTVRVDVTRLSDKAGDAFEVKLPVLPDRQDEKFAYFTTLQAGVTRLKDFPDGARPGTASQQLVFTNQPGLLEFASGLEYLSLYPHGCLEQRMSQVYPDLALGGLLKKMELDTRFTPQVKNTVKKLLDEVAQHQDEQGFVGYWPGTKGDIALTAQALEFMTAAKKAGVPVDEKAYARCGEALKRVLRTDFVGLWSDWRYNQQASALRALGRAGQLDENYAVQLFHQRNKMDASSIAELTTAMADRPGVFATNLTALKDELWSSVVFKVVKGNQVYDGIRGDRSNWYGPYLGSSAGTTATVWEALLRIDPQNEKHPLIRDALLSQGAATNGWGSTYSNRRAITSLALYLESAKSSQGKTALNVTGLGDLVLDDAHKALKRTSESPDPLSVNLTQGGPLGARVQYRYLAVAPGDQASPKKQGLVVSRTLTWMHSDGSAPTHHEDTPGGTLRIPLGEVLEVHAQLVNDETHHQVALVVPFAAGLEPLNPNLENASSDARPSQADSLTPTYVQRLDNEVRYYFSELPRGTFTFHFRVRASSEGSFVHPPPWAEMMYREEVRGRGAGTRIVVTGTKEK